MIIFYSYTQIVPELTSRSPFNLVSISFLYAPAFLKHSLLSDVKKIFQTPLPKSVIDHLFIQRDLVAFNGEQYLKANIQVQDISFTLGVLLLPGPINRIRKCMYMYNTHTLTHTYTHQRITSKFIYIINMCTHRFASIYLYLVPYIENGELISKSNPTSQDSIQLSFSLYF